MLLLILVRPVVDGGSRGGAGKKIHLPSPGRTPMVGTHSTVGT